MQYRPFGQTGESVSVLGFGAMRFETENGIIKEKEAVSLLRAAIDGLAEREKKIIMLRYFRDMTQSEVAAVIGVSQVQISRIESRVMQDMKKKLD